MDTISTKLRRRISRDAASAPALKQAKRRGNALPGGVMDIQSLINDGLDPIHAAYAYIQQITSYFAEQVSQFPELKKYYKLAAAAEDSYMPSGPPISPLTGSFFTCWAFFDLRIGTHGETIGACLSDLGDLFSLTPDQFDALKKLNDSRMGAYEHVGFDGSHIRLRELITNDELACHNPSGYRGQPGDLWYARLLPPLLPERATYHIVFTTPYILIGNDKEEWTQFLRRSVVRINTGDERASLHELLKCGFEPNYWSEFIFRAYHHHRNDAIYLTGIPDLRATLPHA